MISSLSSFIEFMAAIYVTMSIDNLIARRFWTRNYETMLNSLFLKWRVPYISSTDPNEKNDIEDLQESEELLSRRRGLLMLTACVGLLVYIGFEPKTDVMSMRDVAITYFSLDITYMFLLVTFFLDHLFLSNRLAVLSSILGVPTVFMLCELLKGYLPFGAMSDLYVVLLYNAPGYTVLVLLVPVLWQLIRNWLYSHKNMVRIQYLLKDELLKLEQAQAYTSNVDINTIAEWYRNDAVKKMSSSGTEDIVGGHLIQTFNYKLREIIKSPRVRDILPYINRKPLEDIENVGTTIHYVQSVDSTLNSLCVEYDKLKKKPTLEEFAKRKNVNLQELREYYSKWVIRNLKGKPPIE